MVGEQARIGIPPWLRLCCIRAGCSRHLQVRAWRPRWGDIRRAAGAHGGLCHTARRHRTASDVDHGQRLQWGIWHLPGLPGLPGGAVALLAHAGLRPTGALPLCGVLRVAVLPRGPRPRGRAAWRRAAGHVLRPGHGRRLLAPGLPFTPLIPRAAGCCRRRLGQHGPPFSSIRGPGPQAWRVLRVARRCRPDPRDEARASAYP
mmetsp:Transcript_32609/g.89934  ORF Transcript_32609/g.89934 Transcript_32609/m.89934 type:complete len:203 (-) Transcript_32609:18-626(-)